MFVQQRIHQDQLQQMTEMIKMLYNVRKQDREDIPCEEKTLQRTREWLVPDAPGSTPFGKDLRGTFRRKQFSPAAGRGRKHAPGQLGFATRCTQCGGSFPEPDYLYTEKTGLCISCWESRVCECQ
jgi:hypothetical protein